MAVQAWLDALREKYLSAEPIGTLELCFIAGPDAVPHYRRNPFKRPLGTPWASWFDSQFTAEGIAVASALGANSGIYQEWANWRPSVSYSYDLFCHLLRLVHHPNTPANVKEVLAPFVALWEPLLQQQITLLQTHEYRAKFAGTEYSGFYRALQTSIKLQERTSTFSPNLVTETFERLQKDLLTQQLKSLAKNESGKGAGRKRDGAK